MKISEVAHHVPATPGLIDRARQFVLRKWQERAQEQGREQPNDLSDACKFASLFAQQIFGGQLSGNWDHQFLILPNGNRLDLTEPSQNLTDIAQAGRDPYRHDRQFWNNPQHRKSMQSCRVRVNKWVTEFMTEINMNETISHRVFYKGYNPGDTRRIRTGNPYWDSKMFLASDPERAKFYGTHIRVFDATPDTKILYQGSRPFISLAKGLRKMLQRPDGHFYLLDYYTRIVERAAKAGYDAVWFTNQGDVGTVVINPQKFIERQNES